MENIRLFSAIMGIIFLGLGYLISGANRLDPGFGHTAFIAGAIIIAGVLISWAIVDKNKKG